MTCARLRCANRTYTSENLLTWEVQVVPAGLTDDTYRLTKYSTSQAEGKGSARNWRCRH